MFQTLGCKLNFAETSDIANDFARHGIRRAKIGEAPGVIVVNTCSVTAVADKKCRQTIAKLSKRFPGAIIVATGCYAQLKGDEVANIPGVKIVAGNDRKSCLTDLLEGFLSSGEPLKAVTPWEEMRKFCPSCSRGDRTRYFLKIQDGCDYRCTYCTVPFARGKSRSGSVSDLLRQAEEVASLGGKEIVLTGVNIGDFGKRGSQGFFDLIRELDQVDGIERYRISSIEPNLLTDEMIEWVARSKRFMPHFHIPLQSGSDRVLALMRRRYNTAMFREKIENIRSAIPEAFIGIDLIVGTRGETDELFEESERFVESIDISRIHVFTYSERPGTKALEIPHSVRAEEKHARARRMISLSDEKLRNFCGRFTGSSRKVLMEHSSKGKPASGFTDNYIKVVVPTADNRLDNRIETVRLIGMAGNGEEMTGEILPS